MFTLILPISFPGDDIHKWKTWKQFYQMFTMNSMHKFNECSYFRWNFSWILQKNSTSFQIFVSTYTWIYIYFHTNSNSTNCGYIMQYLFKYFNTSTIYFCTVQISCRSKNLPLVMGWFPVLVINNSTSHHVHIGLSISVSNHILHE